MASVAEYDDVDRFAEYLEKATSPLGCGLGPFEIQWMFRTGGPALVAEVRRLREIEQRYDDAMSAAEDRRFD